MVLDNIQTYVLQPLIIVLSFISAFYAYKLIKVINKQKKQDELNIMLSRVFKAIAYGFFVWVVAEIVYEILTLMNFSVTPGISDIFYVAGYLFMLWGFAYFATYMYRKSNQKGKEVMTMVIVAIISGTILSRVMNDYTFGFYTGASALQVFLDYFYSIVGAALIVFSSSVFCFFRKLKELGTPLLLLAIATVFDFVGNMLWDYYTWNNTYGIPGIISDLSFATCYALVIATFVIVLKHKEKSRNR